MSFSRRFLNLFRRERLSAEIDREMAFHLAERVDALEAAGMPHEQAVAEARRRFGHRTALRERTRDVDLLVWLESLLADLRYAARALWTSPGFSLVAVLSLGLGIGANTAIFSLMHALVLKPLPVPKAQQLTSVVRKEDITDFTNPIWEALRDARTGLPLFAYGNESFNLAPGGEVRRVDGSWVSGDYFSVLGVRPAAGRLLGSDDDVRGCPPVAVVSAGFARQEFGSPGTGPGRVISLDGHQFTVVGVTEPGFFGATVGHTVQVFAPICSEAIVRGSRSGLDRRGNWWLKIMGRRPEQVSEAEVDGRLAAASPGVFESTVPLHWSTDNQKNYLADQLRGLPAATGWSGLRRQYTEALRVLTVVVGVVLLVACANVAHLLLARAAARQHEMALRLAIGAGRGRIIRQLLTESALLALLGGVVGVGFASWASRLLVSFLSTRSEPVWLDIGLDPMVLGFAILLSTGTGFFFGLLPAWRATRVDPQSALKAQGRGATRAQGRFTSRALVVGQIALSLVLLATAGLLLTSFRRLVTLDPGFERDGVLLAHLEFAGTGWPADRRQEGYRQLLDRLRDLPGVERASASLVTPMSGGGWNEWVKVDGFTPASDDERLVWLNAVTEDWFATLGVGLVAGRDLDRRDGGGGNVAVINQAMAARYFKQESPIGRFFRIEQGNRVGPPVEIVGVVRDSKYETLQEEVRAVAYVPLFRVHESNQQMGQDVIGSYSGSFMSFLLRSRSSGAELMPLVRETIAQASPAITIQFNTLSAQVSESLTRPRLLATLSVFFGGLALLLAVIGLYGTVAYGVARRRAEIGVRLTLGASRRRILGMVLGEVGRVVIPGMMLGVLAALAVTRMVASFLFQLSPADPATLLLAALVLAVASAGAGAVPAWRAASMDPSVTLRQE